MVAVDRDKKSKCWVVTRTDSEGFHRQLTLTKSEMYELINDFIRKSNDVE